MADEQQPEQMHPARGAGRDSDSQKNILRKVINTLSENHTDVKSYHKEKVGIASDTNTLLTNLVSQGNQEQKDKENEKGDKKEEEVERKGLFKKLANLPSALKESAQRVKDAPSNLMSSLGKKVKGFGGMLGKLAAGAGIGILAIVATAGLMSSGLIDGEKVKKNVLSLLSIGDEMNLAKLATLIAFPTAMKQIATGLVFFSAGGGIAGMTQGLLDKFDQGNWADKTKQNVLTLLSIGESLDAAKLVTLGLFKPAMTALAVGLGAFGIGTALAGIGQLIGFDAQLLKNQVLTLLSIGNEVGLADIGTLLAFAPAMTALGVGLAAFGVGSGIAGVAQLTSFDAQVVKDQVLTLLSIPQGLDNGALSMLSDGGAVSLALAGLGVGLAAFGIGSLLNTFQSDDMGQKIKGNVVTLLSIPDSVEGDIVAKSANFSTAMGSLSAGLAKFSAGNLISSLANAGAGILNFFTGGQSPIEQMFAIADREDDIKKAARGIDRLQNALHKLSGISIGGGNIDIQGMLDSFGHLPRLLRGLAYGGEVEFETTGFNKKVDFAKGILDPTLKIPEISATMNQVNSALGIGPVRNAELNTQTSSNAELKMDAMTSSGDSTVIAPTTNTTNNTSSQAVYGDASPATDDLDRVA